MNRGRYGGQEERRRIRTKVRDGVGKEGGESKEMIRRGRGSRKGERGWKGKRKRKYEEKIKEEMKRDKMKGGRHGSGSMRPF